jgi:hypothetical protein
METIPPLGRYKVLEYSDSSLVLKYRVERKFWWLKIYFAIPLVSFVSLFLFKVAFISNTWNVLIVMNFVLLVFLGLIILYYRVNVPPNIISVQRGKIYLEYPSLFGATTKKEFLSGEIKYIQPGHDEPPTSHRGVAIMWRSAIRIHLKNGQYEELQFTSYASYDSDALDESIAMAKIFAAIGGIEFQPYCF